MRVEAAPFVYLSEDRRQRFEDRRTAEDDRRIEPAHATTRARQRHSPRNPLQPRQHHRKEKLLRPLRAAPKARAESGHDRPDAVGETLPPLRLNHGPRRPVLLDAPTQRGIARRQEVPALRHRKDFPADTEHLPRQTKRTNFKRRKRHAAEPKPPPAPAQARNSARPSERARGPGFGVWRLGSRTSGQGDRVREIGSGKWSLVSSPWSLVLLRH